MDKGQLLVTGDWCHYKLCADNLYMIHIHTQLFFLPSQSMRGILPLFTFNLANCLVPAGESRSNLACYIKYKTSFDCHLISPTFHVLACNV